MLNGKTAVITGASRGIGAAIALKYASLGANVAVIYAGNQKLAAEVCEECSKFSGKAIPYCCNVADFEAAKETVTHIKSDFGAIDILVNNAGIARDGLIAMMKEADFDTVIGTNLKGAFNMIRHVTPIFIRSRGGKIINISSIAGLMGNAGQANYAASKAGLIGLTKSVARELAGKNILCNAIAPGFIRTDMTSGFDETATVAGIPLKRMGAPEDIAELAAFLASDCSNYITGEVIRVDGGLAM